MKQEKERFDLRAAFREEPAFCHDALMDAARSVKEDETVKKHTMRTVLIAALIIVAMMTAALAAGGGGLVNWMKQAWKLDVPKSAQEVLASTAPVTLEAGPVAFHVGDLLCDGKLVYMGAEAAFAGEGGAVLCPGSGDPNDPIGENLAGKLAHPGLNGNSSYLEVAKATGLPLYMVTAWLETENGTMPDSEMMDGGPNENGALMLVDMLYFPERFDVENLPVKICVMAERLDTETLERAGDEYWRSEMPYTLQVEGITGERDYTPAQPAPSIEGFTLTGVHATSTCAGIYVRLDFQADKPMTYEEIARTFFPCRVLNGQGEPYPDGISFTAEVRAGDGQPFPDNMTELPLTDRMQYVLMIGAEELPESFIVVHGEEQIPVK